MAQDRFYISRHDFIEGGVTINGWRVYDRATGNAATGTKGAGRPGGYANRREAQRVADARNRAHRDVLRAQARKKKEEGK